MFVVATEGCKTEPQYFSQLGASSSEVHVECVAGLHQNAPLQVLRRIKEYIKRKGLAKSDEAWIVVDRDCWAEQDLDELLNWARTSRNYDLAVSNPKFEIWLLMHYEDALGIGSSNECSARLRRYLPHYDKSIDPRMLDSKIVQAAISRAKAKDVPKCEGWPTCAGTTVYRLVERILEGA